MKQIILLILFGSIAGVFGSTLVRSIFGLWPVGQFMGAFFSGIAVGLYAR